MSSDQSKVIRPRQMGERRLVGRPMPTGVPGTEEGEVTRHLARIEDNAAAKDMLFERLQAELLRLARAQLRNQPGDISFQSSGLINEAYIRIAGSPGGKWRSRRDFLAYACRTMRSILVDHARRKRTRKRSDGLRLDLDDANVPAATFSIDVLSLNVALEELEKLDPLRAQVVDMVAFGGMTLAEVGEILGVSRSTVRRRWRETGSWLRSRLA